MGKKALALIGSGLAFVYILNPTAGADFIPDIVPIFGNLDEATATGILIWGIKTLFGKDETKELNDVLDDNRKKKN